VNDKQELKDAYKKAVSINKISASNLLYLHKITQNTLDKWLYVADRYPDFQACYELYKFIRGLHGKLPVELQRIIARSNTRVNDAISRLEKNPISDFEIIGGRKQAGAKPAKRFVLNKIELSISEIADNFGITANSVFCRTKHLDYGADVSEIDFSFKKIGRQEKKYLFENEELTIKEISEKLNIERNKTYQIIKKLNLKEIK
jgi:predicted DNA-binding protein YlxM (UPF0122 family)